MFSLLLAATLACQALSTVPVIVRSPSGGYPVSTRDFWMEYGPPCLGKYAGRVDNPYPFKVVQPGPFAPPSEFWVFGVVPWALNVTR